MADTAPAAPDGIRDEHQQGPRGLGRHPGIPSLVVLALVMLFALLGFAGREATLRAAAAGTTLEWHAPERIRNGEFFEIRIRVRSDEPIGDVTLEIPESLWRDFTINTFIPAAAEETGEDGSFRFSFGPLDAGTELTVKVDAQINPDILGANQGEVVVLDGDEELVSMPIRIEVLP